MNRNSFPILFIVALSILSITACKKEGCTNPAALNYNADADENDGTCVMGNTRSQVITVTANQWVGGGAGYFAELSAPFLNASIVESGAVLCYLISEEDTYLALPSSIWYGGWTRHFNYEYEIGQIFILIQDDDNATPLPGQVRFKVVTLTSNAIAANPGLDINNYEAVRSALELEE